MAEGVLQATDDGDFDLDMFFFDGGRSSQQGTALPPLMSPGVPAPTSDLPSAWEVNGPGDHRGAPPTGCLEKANQDERSPSDITSIIAHLRSLATETCADPERSASPSSHPANPGTTLSGEQGAAIAMESGAGHWPDLHGHFADVASNLKRKSAAKIYICSECGKTCPCQSAYLRHQRIHTGEKPYACADCGKSFIQVSDYNNHVRSHTGEKPYTCAECGKSFSRSTYLVTHSRTHTKEKPYGCNVCGKSFVQHSHLSLHLRVHSGERPFICIECGNSFSRSSTLAKHRKSHRRRTLRMYQKQNGGGEEEEEATACNFTQNTPPTWGGAAERDSAADAVCLADVTLIKSEAEESADFYQQSAECGKKAKPIRITLEKYLVVEDPSRGGAPHKKTAWKKKTKLSEKAGAGATCDCSDKTPAETPNEIPNETLAQTSVEVPNGIQTRDCSVQRATITDKPKTEAAFCHRALENEGGATGLPEPRPSPPDPPHVRKILVTSETPDCSVQRVTIADKPKTEAAFSHHALENGGGATGLPEPRPSPPDPPHVRKILVTNETPGYSVQRMTIADKPKTEATFSHRALENGGGATELPEPHPSPPDPPHVRKILVTNETPGYSVQRVTIADKPKTEAAFSHHTLENGGGATGLPEPRPSRPDPPHVPKILITAPESGDTTNTGVTKREAEPPSFYPECTGAFGEKVQGLRRAPSLFICSYCGKCCPCKSAFLRHQRIHTGEKPYTCPNCGKSFIQASDYNNHVRAHTGEKPYTCAECGKSFSRSTYLVTHHRTHTKEKPYGCLECGKSFVQHSHLAIHRRVHSGERPYRCRECGKHFNRSSTLLKHQKGHARKDRQISKMAAAFLPPAQIPAK
ncbi:uncharacterized protein PAF06_019065 [Gastrophryne carolinensis]